MARHRMNMEWTLASCRTPRSNRKMVEEALFKPSAGGNRVAKQKPKKKSKTPKKAEIKGSWDHTGDDSSQVAEGEGNDSEDGSDDSTDKAYAQGPALTSRGHLKGRNNRKQMHGGARHSNKKTGSAGPQGNKMQAFSRSKASLNRLRDIDETPTKKGGAGLYAQRRRESTYSSLLDSDSELSTFTIDEEEEAAMNELNLMISDSDESASEGDSEDEISSDGIDEFADDSDDEAGDDDDDDQSIMDEETDFIIGVPPTSDETVVEPSRHMTRSPSVFSDDTEDEVDCDIYMDMDDPVVRDIMNHTSTINDDEGNWTDGMLEAYYSDELGEDSEDSDSDATIYDEETPRPMKTVDDTDTPETAVPSTPVTPVSRKDSIASSTESVQLPKVGNFKAKPDRIICMVERANGQNRLLVISFEDYKKNDGTNSALSTPGPKASEELFAYLPSASQYSTSMPSDDQFSMLSFDKLLFGGSDWEESSVIDANTLPQWSDYLIEGIEGFSEEDFSNSASIETLSLFDEDRRGSESAVPAFAVPITAFRANQNNALSRRHNSISGVHSSGIKKHAPRKDSSLTPSQRRKSDATLRREKTPTPASLFPVPLEPLFADTTMPAPQTA